jgi:hypothetical protein
MTGSDKKRKLAQGRYSHHEPRRGFRRNQPCWHLDFGLPASRTVIQEISIV